MKTLDLNLSTRPFKPYRAANLGMFVLLLLLIGLSVWQGYNYKRYFALASGIQERELELRTEDEVLTGRIAEVTTRMSRSDVQEKLSEVDFLNELIVRKTFSWTRVFATLERILPEGVHLTSLTPTVLDDGTILLSIGVRGRTPTEAYQFVSTLEESKVFANINVPVKEKVDPLPTGEVELAVHVNYFPERGTE